MRFLLWQLPGSLADVLSDSETNLKDLENLKNEFEAARGFWQPFWDFFRLKWGESQLYHEQSFALILKYFFVTFRICILSLFFTFIFSFLYFLFSRSFSEFLSRLLLAVPAIAAYPLFVYFLCEKSSYCPAGSSNIRLGILFAAIAQAFLSAPRFYREFEWELNEIRRKRFVLILRAKGLSKFVIWSKHIFMNAVAPAFSLVLLTVLSFVSGAVLLEALFDLPGMGLLLLEAIRARDFSLIFPLVMFLSLIHLLTLQSGKFIKSGALRNV